MAINTHYCSVSYGEPLGGAAREHAPVNIASQTTLYTGRLARIGTDGYAKEGSTAPGQPGYVVHRGVDRASVKGSQAIKSTLTGSLLTETAGIGSVSLIPVRDGVKILTTEYTGASFAINAPLKCGTGCGLWRLASATTESNVRGYVVAAPHSVHGFTVLEIRLANGPV